MFAQTPLGEQKVFPLDKAHPRRSVAARIMIPTELGPIRAQAGRSAPLELWLYSVFALAVTIADFVVVPACPVGVRAQLVPLTGWLASMPYAPSLFFGFFLIFFGRTSRFGPPTIRRTFRRGITVLLLLQSGLAFSTSPRLAVRRSAIHG